eukprot:Rhum_TRINITY_DN14616_c8_g1::Rhum_TRINITY_DN14616_c8_g1_i1::g.102313::m.102313
MVHKSITLFDCLRLPDRPEKVLVLVRRHLQVVVATLLDLPLLLSHSKVLRLLLALRQLLRRLQGVGLQRHAVADLRQNRVRYVQLLRERLHHLLRARGADVVLRRDGRVVLEHRLRHLDRQEKRQEVTDAEAAAAGTDLLARVGRAHTLDELQERRLLANVALQDVRGEDLVKDVVALDVHKHLVAHNPHVLLVRDEVAEQREDVLVPRPQDEHRDHRHLLLELRLVLRGQDQRLNLRRLDVHVDDADERQAASRHQSVEHSLRQTLRHLALLHERLRRQTAVVRPRDAQEREALARDLTVVRHTLDELAQVLHALRKVLHTLSDLLDVTGNVAHRAEGVVDRQVHLALVLERNLEVLRVQLRRVARHRRLDDGLAGRHHASVEVNLRREAEGVLQRVEEPVAVVHVADPVVRVRRARRAVEHRRDVHQTRQHAVRVAEARRAGVRARALHEADDRSLVRLLRVVREVVGEHLHRLEGAELDRVLLAAVVHNTRVLVHVQLRRQELRVKLLVVREHLVDLARRALEAEDGNALATRVHVVEPLHRRGVEVVVRLVRVARLRRHDHLRAARVLAAHQQRARALADVLGRHPPAGARDELRDEVLVLALVGLGVLGTRHQLRPVRAGLSDALLQRVGHEELDLSAHRVEAALLRERVQRSLQLLVLRQRLDAVHEHMRVVEAVVVLRGLARHCCDVVVFFSGLCQ